MPLYAYRCNDCGNEFETRQRMSEDPLTECPVCEGYIRRVIDKVGVVFKGSGFYVTDNKSKNSAAPTTKEGESDTAGKNGTGESAKGDTPAADAAGKSETKAKKADKPAKTEKKAEKSST